MDRKYEGIVLNKPVNKIKMYDDQIIAEFSYGMKAEQEYVE